MRPYSHSYGVTEFALDGIHDTALKKRKARMIEHLRKSVTESGDTSQLVVLLLIANRLLQ